MSDQGETPSEERIGLEEAFNNAERARLTLGTLIEEVLPRVDSDGDFSDEDIDSLGEHIEDVRSTLATLKGRMSTVQLFLEAQRAAEEDGRNAGGVAEDAIASLRGYADDVHHDEDDPKELAERMTNRADELAGELEKCDDW